MTKKMKCTCKNDYQDKRYGEGMRVHNSTSGKNNIYWRCTVCRQGKA